MVDRNINIFNAAFPSIKAIKKPGNQNNSFKFLLRKVFII